MSNTRSAEGDPLYANEIHLLNDFLNKPESVTATYKAWASEFQKEICDVRPAALEKTKWLFKEIVRGNSFSHTDQPLLVKVHGDVPHNINVDKNFQSTVNTVLKFLPIRCSIHIKDGVKQEPPFGLTVTRVRDLQPPKNTGDVTIVRDPQNHLDRLATKLTESGKKHHVTMIHHSLAVAHKFFQSILITGSDADVYVANPRVTWQSPMLQKRVFRELSVAIELLLKDVKDKKEKIGEQYQNSNINFYYYNAPASLRATVIRCIDSPQDSFLITGYYITNPSKELFEYGHAGHGPLYDIHVKGDHPEFSGLEEFIRSSALAMVGHDPRSGLTRPKKEDLALTISKGELVFHDSILEELSEEEFAKQSEDLNRK